MSERTLEELVERVRNIWATRLEGNSDAVVLGRYELDHVIGQGSSGVVFAAFERELERDVAVKVFRSPVSAAHIRHEARVQAKLNHPNIVAIHDIGQSGDFVYLVMEFVDGETMHQRIGAGIRWPQVVSLFTQAGRGLAAAHQAGVIHGDIKPGNILIGRDGGVRVGDFGLAQLRDQAGPENRGGTRPYTAPELWLGREAEASSDQFSFCVAVWEALYGGRPWGMAVEALMGATPVKHEPRPEVPRQLERAVRRGLSVSPRDRFPNIDALVDALGPSGGTPWPTSTHANSARTSAAFVKLAD